MENSIDDLRRFIELFDTQEYDRNFEKNHKSWSFKFHDLNAWVRGKLQNNRFHDVNISLKLDKNDIQSLVNKYRPILAEMECEDNLARIKQIEKNIEGAKKEIEKRKAKLCI